MGLVIAVTLTLGAERTARCAEAASAETPAAATDPRLASFDRMIESFMRRHAVPGGALAVTDHGRLVYARGFGLADVERGTPVVPSSLFRIASVSKPITAVAVLRLVEQGHLSLDDRVFDILSPKFDPSGTPDSDERLDEITIRHLLQHRGGWDRDHSFDPMFQSVRFAEAMGVDPPAEPEHIIRCMLSQKLDFAPGERYAYSNFGYCLLGRVIETASGETYESFVQRRVLDSLGIDGMRLGRTHREDQNQDEEVRYYDAGSGPSVFAADLGQDVPQPYGAWCLEAMDAHGAWLASVVDLARFAVAFDDPAACPVLRLESIEMMFARPPGHAGLDENGQPKASYYGLGWLVRPVGDDRRNTWHSGSLPGTAAILIRRHDQRNFIALLNTRTSPHVKRLSRELDPLLHRAANEVSEWPQTDLFEAFGKGSSIE